MIFNKKTWPRDKKMYARLPANGHFQQLLEIMTLIACYHKNYTV